MRLWNVAGGQEVRAFSPGPDVLVRSLAFSPDGRRVVSGDNGGAVRLWDATSGQQTLLCKGHEGSVLKVVFSPDGRTVISVCMEDETIRLWEVATGEQRRQLRVKGYRSEVGCRRTGGPLRPVARRGVSCCGT